MESMDSPQGQKPMENFTIEVIPDGKGGYDWVARGKVRKSSETLDERGRVKTTIVSSTRGFKRIASKDGKSIVVVNANVMFPKGRSVPANVSQAVRIVYDDNGKEIARVPV